MRRVHIYASVIPTENGQSAEQPITWKVKKFNSLGCLFDSN